MRHPDRSRRDKTAPTVPVMKIWLALAAIPDATCRRRARRRTSPQNPRRCAAAIVAQAPVPQASVMPTPRSHTRMRKRFGASTLTNSTLMRSGNSGCVLDLAAHPVNRRVVGVSRQTTRNADCRHSTAPTLAAPARRNLQRKLFVSISRASGMSRQSEFRHAHVDRDLIAGHMCSRAPAFGVEPTWRPRRFSSISSRATQRAALPQLSTSPPSAL